MGIHSEIDPLDEADIDDLVAADALLADALAKFAESEFSTANRRNRDTLGDWVPYTVAVDGQTVYEGRGEVFPERQVAQAFARDRSQRERQRDANVEFGRRVRKIVVDWFWEKANERLLARLIETLIRIRHGYHAAEDISGFATIFGAGGPDAADLLKYLIERWLAHKTRWFRGLQDARALFRVYRLLRLIASGSGGSYNDVADDEQDELLRWIATALVERSPVVTGEYRSSHALYADGAMIADAGAIAADAAIPAGKVYAFVNSTPYARRLETGLVKTGRRKGQPFVRQAEPHLYESVARDAQVRAGSEAQVRFNYTNLDSGRTTPRSGARYELLFPTIIVTFR